MRKSSTIAVMSCAILLLGAGSDRLQANPAAPETMIAIHDVVRATISSVYCDFKLNNLKVREHLRVNGFDANDSESVGHYASFSATEGEKWKALFAARSTKGRQLRRACESVMKELGGGMGLISPKEEQPDRLPRLRGRPGTQADPRADPRGVKLTGGRLHGWPDTVTA